MFKTILVTVVAGTLFLSGVGNAAERIGVGNRDLEPAINGAVSANGLFPTQAMEEEFAAYLRWAKDRGLSRLTAFESMFDSGDRTAASLPNERMGEQFGAYLRWVDEQGLSPFYALMVTDFD
jgi:hypothetical protein